MRRMKKLAACVLALALVLPVFRTGTAAKTNPAGQTVGTVLFYVRNSESENVLISQIPISEMEADRRAGRIDTTLHNYSVLDRYVTTVHQEAEGFTVPEFVDYAQSKSSLSGLRNLSLSFAGTDEIAFWEIDQTGFDDMDTYSYDDLYGVARYNFPLLYQYWNYRTQDYYDPAGKLSREEVIDHIFQSGEPETMLLSVRAFSQRYMITDEKYGAGDYNMENLWRDSELLDNERAIRMLLPMTKDELYNKTPTAANSRYWVANILLDMAKAPSIPSMGKVPVPTAAMTEDADNYYVSFQCATPGATVLYNHNYISPSYTPSSEYTGGDVVIPKHYFPSGTVTMTCRAVKDGYTDAGVQTLTLTASGVKAAWENPYSDVASDSWYYDCVQYVTEQELFDATGAGKFSPDAPMTRAMLATALYRMAGRPKAAGITSTPFTDVPPSADYADAVAWAYQNGVVNGVSAEHFSPDGLLAREQFATMLWRYAKATGRETAVRGELSRFPDSGDVASWAREPMAWAVGETLINGTGTGTLAPRATATRSQAAQVLMKYGR